MPEFLPFRGIRYAAAPPAAAGPTDVGEVAAPPYDVIDEERRAALEAAHPNNAVRLILPRDGDDGRSRYQVAADCLAAWCHDATLVADETPHLYVYRMDFRDEDGRDRHTLGVIGALGLSDRGGAESTVLPHERTLSKAKSDRLALLRTTRANFDPIWGLSLAASLSELLAVDAPELAHCEDHEGVRHRLFPLRDPDRIAAVGDAVASAPVVLADGHHRFETACAYRDERVAAGIDDPGAERIMTFIVELADEQLCVRAIHRLLTGVVDTDVRAVLSETFTVIDAGPNTPEGVSSLRDGMGTHAALGLVDRSGLALLVPRERVLEARMAELPAALHDVDSARFDAGVRRAVPGASVAFRSDAAAVAALVDKGAADAAVLLRPVTVGQIRAAAFGGVRMPEKTTFFHPKPRTGMVFRSLDG